MQLRLHQANQPDHKADGNAGGDDKNSGEDKDRLKRGSDASSQGRRLKPKTAIGSFLMDNPVNNLAAESSNYDAHVCTDMAKDD